MNFSSPLLASLTLAGALSANAVTVTNYGAYTLSYDETTSFSFTDFSFNGGGGSTGFGWNVDPSVLVISGGPLATATFALPDFTITANPGWALSGNVTGFLGNLVFNEYLGATTTAAVAGMASVDGGPAVTLGGPMTRTVTSSTAGLFSAGNYFGSGSVTVGSFSSFSFTGGSLVLTASGGAFSSVISQPQNELRFGLVANPVPEPETAALLVAGLLALGSLAYRRRPG